MKNKKYIIALSGLLLMAAACTDNESPEREMQTDNWVFSRAENGKIDNLLIVGKHLDNAEKDFQKKLTFDANGNGQWEGGSSPTWADGDMYDLIAFYPADKYTADGKVNDQTACQMQYWEDRVKSGTQDNRPTTFTLEHLMGQLLVHVTVKELATEHHEPKDMEISLYTEGVVNFLNKHVTPTGRKSWKSLVGFFHEEIDPDAVKPVEGEMGTHKWVMDFPITIIPQTMEAGQLAVTFNVDDPYYGNAHYEFTPDVPLVFAAGKLTHLYLGVVYEHLEEVPVINVVDCKVTVTDWIPDSNPTAGDATEQ